MIADKSWDQSLPSRVKNALKLRGIFSLAQLVAAAKEGEIQCMRNCGKQGMDAVYKLIESAQTPGALFSKASEMSLRDYFAGQVISECYREMVNSDYHRSAHVLGAVGQAYSIAEAMIEASRKEAAK